MKAGEYSGKGDYHRDLDRNWSYFPVYLEKIAHIDRLLDGFGNRKILDAGCGEGVLVEKYRGKGYDIVGLDLNYSSKYVKQGDIMDMPYRNEAFDVLLCLDVLEHLNISDHEQAMKELFRVTRKGGNIIFSLPNLAHFASRISFLFTGNLIRTSDAGRHPGDRPIREFIRLMEKCNLKILKKNGLFPTFPLISLITLKATSKSLIFHKIYNKLVPLSNICFGNIILTKK